MCHLGCLPSLTLSVLCSSSQIFKKPRQAKPSSDLQPEYLTLDSWLLLFNLDAVVFLIYSAVLKLVNVWVWHTVRHQYITANIITIVKIK